MYQIQKEKVLEGLRITETSVHLISISFDTLFLKIIKDNYCHSRRILLLTKYSIPLTRLQKTILNSFIRNIVYFYRK